MKNTFELQELLPGFKVCRYETDRFKTGRLSLYLILPLPEEPAAEAILPYLFSRTSAAFPDMLSLNKRLAELYGATLNPFVNKMGENHVIGFSMTMIDSRFALNGEDLMRECAELLASVLFEPNLTGGVLSPEDLDREKRLMTERIDGEINDKRFYAYRRLIETMCDKEAYRVSALGSRDGVAALTPESVTETWKHVLKTARFQLNAVGSGGLDTAAEVFRARLAAMERGPLAAIHTEVVERADTIRRVEEEQPVKQGKLVLGYRAGMRDAEAEYPVLRMMTDIFGGGTYSRCFENVREKQSLCYYCSARFLSQKGIVIVQSGIENENAEKAIAEIGKQLQGMAGGDITEEDLQKSVRSMKDAFGTICDNPLDIDGWAASQLCDPAFQTPDELVERCAAVTREQAVEAAKRMTLDTVFLLKGTLTEGDSAPDEEVPA